ncbi:MAG: rhodanese-like domain-containing protein [Firmicutes bacterium]|nr:rhodanese-like domain-containing protein [Bacillota bacterium]
MGLLDFLKGPNINEGLEKYRQYKYAVLVDLRSEKAYTEGHVPGSINLPLEIIGKAMYVLDDKMAPIFVYAWDKDDCQKGATALKALGYNNVTILGSCERYTGEIETGMLEQKTEE